MERNLSLSRDCDRHFHAGGPGPCRHDKPLCRLDARIAFAAIGKTSAADDLPLGQRLRIGREDISAGAHGARPPSFRGARRDALGITGCRNPSFPSSKSISTIRTGSRPWANSSTRCTGSSGTTTTGGYTPRSRCGRNYLPNATGNSQRCCLTTEGVDIDGLSSFRGEHYKPDASLR